MDPITAAIIAGLAEGATKVATSAVADAYEALKATITRKLGGESRVAKAVAGLEVRPDSNAWKGVLQEEVAAARADQDPDIRKAAQALLDQINLKPSGAQYSQKLSGSGAAAILGGVAAGEGGIAIGGNVEGGIGMPRRSTPEQ
jgi:hypothetical protein